MTPKTIARVVVKRFRSFPSAVIDIENPLFLVGRNGAGKSNIADVFSFVAEAMVLPLQAVFDRNGGISTVRNRSSVQSAPPNIGLRFEFGPSESVESGHYAFEVKALPNYGFRIVREQCLVCTSQGKRWWFDRGSAFDSNASGLVPALGLTALALPLVGGDERFAPVFKILGGMRVYAIEPGKLRQMQDPDSGLSLKADGSNAASVLQELTTRGSEQERMRADIYHFLEAIVPNTTAVVPKKHGNKLSMTFVQQWADKKKLTFDAFSMSDGTLRSLGLILSVLQQPSPSLVVIEEPEATIHSGALDALLDLIQRASRTMQVLVTTHSPDLLDAPWLTDENIRIVTWEEGASHILRLSDETRGALRAHLMGAGEMLRSNALRPENLFADTSALRVGDLFETLN